MPPRPSLVGWSRIEPLPTSADLEPALQAQVADPLWMLGRQWQFGELGGEDAGSPVEVALRGTVAALSRYLPGRPGGGGTAVDLAGASVPLEALVEAEPLRAGSERLRTEAGLHFLRLLSAGELPELRERFVSAYAAEEPVTGSGPVSPASETRRRLLGGRVPDGARLAAAFEPFAAADGTLGGLPDAPPVPPEAQDAVRAIAAAWLRWWRDQVHEPERPSGWDPGRLEYALAVEADLGDEQVVLAADEYAGGRLDWFSFDLLPDASLGGTGGGGAGGGAAPAREITAVTLPTRASYPGMPADRLWQFEDARVFLGRLDAGPTDLGRILLVEFALAFGNDWFLTPVDLPAGSVFRLDSLVVRDTFEIATEVPPSHDTDGARWTMFSTAPPGAARDDLELFFLPPTLASTLEGDPIEEVALFRDEMANLVWAVERVVPDLAGERIDRAHEPGRTSLRQELPADLADAQMVYRLMTPVPDHWIPFVPVPAAGQPAGSGVLELGRGSILRFRADGTSDRAQPRGMLLRADPALPVEDDALRLAEEEVPRSGIVVRRIVQLGRTADGRTVVWLGRDKRSGRGEGSSGMRFDTADPAGG